ncbi:hypothetical protein SAMN04488595_116112 [Ralstonia sp. 25mfcol4.1]|nr:hypothetical protein [Ralstonia sp. 25mfcol4.1]SDP68959.1 hypothetical protein SAMN04488595_116112 [Ralstonia sp. 25mfcol4.1]
MAGNQNKCDGALRIVRVGAPAAPGCHYSYATVFNAMVFGPSV